MSMKPYGLARNENANRNLPGTSRACPCCNDRAHKAKGTKGKKKTARRIAKAQTRNEMEAEEE